MPANVLEDTILILEKLSKKFKEPGLNVSKAGYGVLGNLRIFHSMKNSLLWLLGRFRKIFIFNVQIQDG